jgi:hypothetical protein
MNIIKQIIYENGYNEKVLQPKRSKLNKIQEGKEEEKEQTKWALFTYNGKQTRFITKLFITQISE